MPDVLGELALTGATTLVAAMATSAWATARAKAVALFRRGGPAGHGMADQLDRSAARLAAADDDAPAVRDGQIARWREELTDLLREHPGIEAELRSLIEEVDRRLPAATREWVQHVTAHAGGSAFGAQGPGAAVVVHYHAGSGAPPPATTPGPDPDAAPGPGSADRGASPGPGSADPDRG
jgi:hypothetical protein